MLNNLEVSAVGRTTPLVHIPFDLNSPNFPQAAFEYNKDSMTEQDVTLCDREVTSTTFAADR